MHVFSKKNKKILLKNAPIIRVRFLDVLCFFLSRKKGKLFPNFAEVGNFETALGELLFAFGCGKDDDLSTAF